MRVAAGCAPVFAWCRHWGRIMSAAHPIGIRPRHRAALRFGFLPLRLERPSHIRVLAYLFPNLLPSPKAAGPWIPAVGAAGRGALADTQRNRLHCAPPRIASRSRCLPVSPQMWRGLGGSLGGREGTPASLIAPRTPLSQELRKVPAANPRRHEEGL